MGFESRLMSIIEEVTLVSGLADGTIGLKANISVRGVKKGQEISKSLSIYEQDYPENPDEVSKLNRTCVIMNIRMQKKIELTISTHRLAVLDLPSDAKVKLAGSGLPFSTVVFDRMSEGMFEFIRQNIVYCLDNYEPGTTFGCCSKYIDCSRVRRCLHVNQLYAKGCSYRRNLEAGRVFYGARGLPVNHS